MREKRYPTLTEERAHELAEERKWEAEHGGTDGDSDRDCDRYERWLDTIGGSA